MSEEQLAALLAKLKQDADLREKLQGASDLDAAEVLAREAGFDVNKVDWFQYQAKQSLNLRDVDLEVVAGGAGGDQAVSDMGKASCCDRNYCAAETV